MDCWTPERESLARGHSAAAITCFMHREIRPRLNSIAIYDSNCAFYRYNNRPIRDSVRRNQDRDDGTREIGVYNRADMLGEREEITTDQ